MRPTITVYGKSGKVICIIGGILLILFGICFYHNAKNENITYFSGTVDNIYNIEENLEENNIKGGFKYYYTAKADVTADHEYNITLIRQSRKKFPYHEEKPEILFPKEGSIIELQKDANGTVSESQRTNTIIVQIAMILMGIMMLIGGIFGKVKEK